MAVIGGMKQLQAAFVAFGKEVEKNKKNALKLAGGAFAADVKRDAPYKTGTYRRSIHVEVLDANTAMVGSDLPYGPRLEYGYADTDALGRTYNQPAQPHFRPAFDMHFAAYQAIYLEALFR